MIYFAFRTKNANIFADDAGFLGTFALNGFSTLGKDMANYVPGRNLHVFFQDIWFAISSTEINTFYIYHLMQSVMYVAVFFIAYKVMKRAGAPEFQALSLSVFGALFPLTAIVSLWASALPMHLTSTLFLLFAIYMIVPGHSGKQNYFGSSFLLVLFLGISMFIYDQSAAVVLSLTLVSLYLTLLKRPNQWLLILGRCEVTLGLLLLSGFYLMVIFLGRGIGSSLTIGHQTLGLLIGNLFFPLKAYFKIRDEHSLAFGLNEVTSFLILFAFVLISIYFFIKFVFSFTKLKQDLGLSNQSKLAIFFFLLSVTSFLPSALWYIAPRHLFLPLILFTTSLSLCNFREFSFLKYGRGFAHILVSVSLLLCFFAQSKVISDWLTRDSLRQSFYLVLANSSSNAKKECFVQGSQLTDISSIVYSEKLNIAMDFYLGGNQERLQGCFHEPKLVTRSVWSCDPLTDHYWYQIDGYQMKNATFVTKIHAKKICSPSDD